MAKTGIIRHRLLYILLLGVVTSAISLIALVRALSLGEGQRLERARDIVGSELDRLVELAPSAAALERSPRTNFIGLRGGWLDSAKVADTLAGLPPDWRVVIEHALAESASKRRSDPTARVIRQEPVGGAQLLVGVAPTPTGGWAWIGYTLLPPTYLQTWRNIAIAIAIATALLVASSLTSALSFRNQTRALTDTLFALGKDLRTPVPRPSLAELGQLAGGIERMAADLLQSREDTERLLRELAQKERLAALGRVAAGVAHEVRNPLAAIKLRLDLTAASNELPPATRVAVAAASAEIDRLDRLVRDLLLVAGSRPGPRRPVALGNLARARAETLAPWAEAQQIRLQIVGDAEAEADPESLARAIDNLFRNAVEASPRGATVTATITSSDDGAALRVEDTGPGVDPKRDGELFEPFFTTKAEGTGLGLALSRAIARAHGGDLLYAREDGLTRFSLSLPTTAPSEA